MWGKSIGFPPGKWPGLSLHGVVSKRECSSVKAEASDV